MGDLRSSNAGLSLLCRVDTRLCALPLESSVEATRALPIEPVPGAPPFVLGLCIVRGAAIPIVDAALLLGSPRSSAARFVILRVGDRRVGLAVDAVLGVRQIAGSFEELPPLLRGTDSSIVSAIGTLDAELLMVLRAVRMVPDEVYASVEAAARAS